MTKAQIIAKVEAAGIEFDNKLKVADLQAIAEDNGIALVDEVVSLTFIVTANLSEGGQHYKPGDAIEVTEERAKALGSLVKPAETE